MSLIMTAIMMLKMQIFHDYCNVIEEDADDGDVIEDYNYSSLVIMLMRIMLVPMMVSDDYWVVFILVIVTRYNL